MAISKAIHDPEIETEILAKFLARSKFDLNVFNDDFVPRSIRMTRSDPIFRNALAKAKAIRADEKAKALRRARDTRAARIFYAFLAFIFLLIVLSAVFC